MSNSPNDIKNIDDMNLCLKSGDDVMSLLQEVYAIFKMYREYPLANSFISPKDYARIFEIYDQVEKLIDSTTKEFTTCEFEGVEKHIPIDLSWKRPSERVYTTKEVEEMILICKKVKKIYDHFEIAWSFHRAWQYEDEMFLEVEYNNLLEYFNEAKELSELGTKKFGIIWDGLYFDIPNDLLWKIP